MPWSATRIHQMRSTLVSTTVSVSGQYRVFYRVDGDVITIERVDRVL
jgi:hypothetical protein